jgi:hypothetical protein
MDLTCIVIEDISCCLELNVVQSTVHENTIQ